MKGLVASSGVLLFCLASASPSAAYEPRAAHWTILEAPRAGEYQPGLTPGGDVRVLIALQQLEELANANVLLVFPNCGEDAANDNRPILNLEQVLKIGARPRYADWSDPGPRWRVCPSDSAVLLSPNNHNQLSLAIDFLRDVSEGLSPRLPVQVHLLSEDDMARIDFEKDIGCQWANIVGGRRPTAEFVIDLYFRLDGQKHTWFLGDYQSVFGAPDPDPLFGRRTGDYNQVASQLPVDVLSFRSNRRIPAQTEDDGGKLFKETLAHVLQEKTALTGESVCNKEDYTLTKIIQGVPSAGTGAPRVTTQDLAFVYHVSGRFSTKWTADHSLHPGFGFRVEAWSNDFFGVWIQLAADWVQSDGTWSLTVPGAPIFSGNTLRIYYRTKTSYYDVQSLAGNHYVWVDPDWTNIPANFSVGHRFADTDGGTYNGIGELVDAAMYNWSRLYWDGGINPVPSSPINIFAPNTTYDCGDGSGNPWSCANRQGNLWLIAAHAVQAEVVAHELGHQLNYKFWNYKNPANTGGSHSLNNCYPLRLGTTLFEGFADFMAGWTGYPGRSVADGGFGSGRWKLDWDLESRTSPPNCSNGWENEVWVARNFWDLHDTRSDGDDVLWFNHLGAVPVLYLANGVANDGDAKDMRDFENTYRNAASAGHQTYISNIFRQNRQ
jgi:hypothetical protein